MRNLGLEYLRFHHSNKCQRENQRMSMRIDVDVLSSFDLIITIRSETEDETERADENEREVYESE